MKGKLFLLDAYALIFRAYFAFAKNPRLTSGGLDTSAIFGFTTTLMEVLEKEKPTHIAVVFDTDKPTERHLTFEAYKANRDETPEGIKIAVPYIKRILEAFRIPSLFKDGFEADDVIGTLAKKAEKEGFEVYMMTPDKDFGQLVTEHIKIFKPARGGGPAEVLGVAEVCDRFEIDRVEQVIDYLGMVGDAVDNIPGLPGVGDKTAKKFLKEFGSLEALLENAHTIKGKLGEKIREHEAQGLLSKQLATIIIDVPIAFEPEALVLEEPNLEEMKTIFEELEFRTLGKRFFERNVERNTPAAEGTQLGLFDAPHNSNTNESNELTINALRTIADTEHHYQLIADEMGCKMLVKQLLKQTSVVFDTETTGLDPISAELVGISFSWNPGKAYYVHLPQTKSECLEWLKILEPFFNHHEIEKVAQNLKYDLAILRSYNISIGGPTFDTMLAHYLIEPDRGHGMDEMAAHYLNYQPVPITALIGNKGKGQGNMRQVAPEKIAEYAGEDADITLQLKLILENGLEESDVRSVFDSIEMPLIPVLEKMERNGIRLDSKALKTLSATLESEIATLENSVMAFADEGFNLNSPKQLGVLLFEKLKLVDKPKKTKTGQYATSEDILTSLIGKHEIIDYILTHRQLVKLKSTYVDALPELVRPDTGRIHTTFNQAIAATGRLSSTAPNLQNIPIRTARGREVRKAFIAGSDQHVILAADYSQIELRIIAALSGDEAMCTAFQSGLDIHAATAAKIFQTPVEEVTRIQRGVAKTVNFGIIYGVSAFGLSQQTDLSRTEAKEVIDSYFVTYPGIKKYMEQQIAFARTHGYVKTIMGRRRYLRDITSRNAVIRGHAERNAINAPIQGSAADIIKLAMIHIHEALQTNNLKSQMLLQVHDELVFDAYLPELEQLKDLIIDKMQHVVDIGIPLIVETGTGKNWLEAH
jgi:DNA polymerase I